MLNFEVWHVVLTAVVLLFLGGVVGGRFAILFSLVKPGEDARADVETVLDRAADKMGAQPSEQWVGWIVHLLRALDGKTASEPYTRVLEAVRKRIGSRLETGRW
jgi:hypothetical protein